MVLLKVFLKGYFVLDLIDVCILLSFWIYVMLFFVKLWKKVICLLVIIINMFWDKDFKYFFKEFFNISKFFNRR